MCIRDSVFGDTENFDDAQTNALMQYIKNGGTIIRFLGPKSLSKEESPFFTAPINLTPHILSTGFAVENLSIAPLPKNSIFSDIELPQKINIGQSILFKSANNDAKTLITVSYTHLDVYKRQIYANAFEIALKKLGAQVFVLSLIHI